MKKPGQTDGGFYIKKDGSSHSVGPQGAGGEMGGKAVSGVNNPRGIEPKSIGGGRMPLSQGPRADNVSRKGSARKG